MKKTKLFFAVAAIGMMLLASCKKDWTCECTVTQNAFPSSTSTLTINDTKSNAEEKCEGMSSSSEFMGVVTKSECKLKN